MGPVTTLFSKKASAWFPWIIVCSGILAYANSFSCPFLFDDTGVITANPHIFHLWPPWAAVLNPTRFVADYSFALNYAWAGFSPAEYRLVNIAIHLLAGLLLYGIIRRTLLLRAKQAPGVALSVALLWVLHPLQTESVTYIAQRIEALMGLFVLLTLYCFIRGVTSSHRRSWMGAGVIACAIGMGTKEVMVTVPILLLLYDGVFVANSWRDVLKSRGALHAAFFATWLVFLALMAAAMARFHAEQMPLFTPGEIRWDYALTQLNVLAHYLKLSFIPTPLCFDYRWPLVSSPAEALWPGTLTVLLGLGTLWALWRRSWLGFLGAFFFIILAPTSSINPLPDAAFEHRMYLPLAAVLTVPVMALYTGIRHLIPRRRPAVWLAAALLCIVAAGLGALTQLRNRDYISAEAMWSDVITKRPDNTRVYLSLSSTLIDQQRYEEAGLVCSNLLSHLPDFSKLSLDNIQATHSSPRDPPRPLHYAMAHNNIGLIAAAQKRPGDAERHYREALRIVPHADWAHRNFGQLLYAQNRVGQAISEWEQALRQNPKDSESHAFLGVALLHQRRFAEAATHFGDAARIKPDFWFAHSQWAWLLATCPVDTVRNGRLAVEIATPLVTEAGPGSPRALDILAAAYAEAGDFSNAVRFADAAITAAATSDPSSARGYSVDDIRLRLESYHSGKPHREP